MMTEVLVQLTLNLNLCKLDTAKCCLKFKKINQIAAWNDALFESDSSDGSDLFISAQ